MDNSTKLRKDTVMLVRLENCVHQSKFQGPANGPMENAGGFLIIPAPSWWGSPEGGGVTLPSSSTPPSPVPELTQMGGGETSGPKGWGSWRVTWWSKGGRVSSTKVTTESRREFLLSPCSYSKQHWLLQKPSIQEMAG